MKSLMCLMAVLASLPVYANETAKTVLVCNNEGDSRLKLSRLPTGEMRADLILESVGDSFPSYHYKNVVASMNNGFTQYESQNGKLKLVFRGSSSQQMKNIPSSLTVSDLEIHNQIVTCSFL